MSWRNTGRSFRERNELDYTNSFDDLSLSDLPDTAIEDEDQPIDMSLTDGLIDLDDLVSDDEPDDDLFTEISYRRNPLGSRLAYD